MKKLFALIPMFFFFHCSAQSVCKIYQYPAGEQSSKKLVATISYDPAGRVTKEVIRGYIRFLNNVNTMYCHKEDGVYQYYYDDSILYKTVITINDDRTNKPIDSNKIFYYYDSVTNCLTSEVTVMHLNKRLPGKKPGSFRKTVEFIYDSRGRLSKKCGTYNRNTVEHLCYDEEGRIVTDSMVSIDPTDGFSVMTKYEYSKGGYKEYTWMSERKYPSITEYKLDSLGRVIEQALWFHKDDENGGCKSTLHTDWKPFLNNDFKQYKQYEKAVTNFDAAGRIAMTFYYFEGIHTTTHEFVYESAASTNNH
jgi:hypothetical protein